MSLDIIAYDPKETKARKNKFKAKYGISYDKFSEFDYKFVSYGNHAQHHVSPEVLKMLVGEED